MVNNKKVLFKIENLKKYFPLKKKTPFSTQEYVRANENISLQIYQGETLGLVGESGSGKSTLGKTILQLHEQTEGTTLYYGKNVYELAPSYVEKLIRNLPKTFPNYKNDMAKLDDLYKKRDEEVKEDKIHDYEDKLIATRRQIQDKYFNTIRIAGGLLVHNDLSKVSQALLKEYKVYQEIAERSRKIETIDLKLVDSDHKGKYAKLESDKARLEKEIEGLGQKLEEAKKSTEILRAEASTKEGFEELEARKDDGIDLSELNSSEMRYLRKDLQMIFQDPYSSLDGKLTVGNIIGEGVVAHDIFNSTKSEGYNEYIQDVMEKCGLAPYFIHRYPHQFSGGQRQRIGIARALALSPNFIVCDEAVSALDVSIQSQVINLLQDLREEEDLTYLFITHDLSVVKYISDRIAVMYLGNIVELCDSEILFANPAHPYTQALLNAIPRTDVDSNQELAVLEGDIPSAVKPPKGCKFHTRCKYCFDRCKMYEPELRDIGEGHLVACHLMDMDEEERKSYTEAIDKKVEEEQRLEDKEMFNEL